MSAVDERRVGALETQLAASEVECKRLAARNRDHLERLDTYRRQVAELEHENVRLETALAERLGHDHHGTAALERDLAAANARLAVVDALTAEALAVGSPNALDEIRDALTGRPAAVLIAADVAEEAVAAVRMLAAIIRNLPAIPPDRLDAVADHLRGLP